MEDTSIKLINLLFAFGGCFLFGWLIGINNALKTNPKKKRKSKYPKCNCSDVNQCDKWCQAKHLFKKDSDRGLV